MKNQKWNTVKGKIIAVHGTLSRAAALFDCSTEGLRLAVKGRCPGIAKKLRDAGLLAA